MKNEDFALFKPYPLEAMEHMQGNGVPVVIKPFVSIDSYGDVYKGDSYWQGSSNHSLNGTLGSINNNISDLSNSKIRSGTIVKTITTANPQKVFTAQELVNMFGSGTGTYTAYVMNGDHAAQGADIITTYIQSGEVYVRFNATPTAGAYRFNYMISRY